MQRSAAILAFVLLFGGLLVIVGLIVTQRSGPSEAQKVYQEYLRAAPKSYDTEKMTLSSTVRLPDSKQSESRLELIRETRTGRMYGTGVLDGEPIEIFGLFLTIDAPPGVVITGEWKRSAGANWTSVDLTKFQPIWDASIKAAKNAPPPRLKELKIVQYGGREAYSLETVSRGRGAGAFESVTVLTIDRENGQLLESISRWRKQQDGFDVVTELRNYDLNKPVTFPTGLPVP